MRPPHLGWVICCASLAVLGSACGTRTSTAARLQATESRLTDRVRTAETRLTEQVGASERRLTEQLASSETRLTERLIATEARLAQRADSQDAQLRDMAERIRAHRQAIDAVADLATGAKTSADLAADAARDAEARLSQRIADRNKYRVLETRFIYFEVDRADIRREDITELDEVASALKDDPNAILEIHGFADPRGSDRYNNELTRNRVDAAIRYLVSYHGIELRQLRAAAMGKTALTAGARAGLDIFGLARRVDMRLLAPWSSWEDRESQLPRSDQAGVASPPTTEGGNRGHATPPIVPREVLPKDERWREIVNTISPQELGARE